MYEIKGIKTLSVYDGVALTANLYREGRIVASVEDRGDGGCMWIHWNKNSGIESALLLDWFDKLEANHWTTHFRNSEFSDKCELAIEWLIEIAQNNKSAKKNILIRVAIEPFPDGMQNFENYQMKNVSLFNREALQSIVNQFVNAEVWDITSQSFVYAKNLLKKRVVA
jgi:hypothetical protein